MSRLTQESGSAEPVGASTDGEKPSGAAEPAIPAGAAEPAIPSAETPPAPPSRFFASIVPGEEHPLAQKFTDAILSLEAALKMPIWLLVQDGDASALDDTVYQGFFRARDELGHGHKVAVLIDSPGGNAKAAYQIATLLRDRCGGFTAIVPRYAKSAATLLSLGADKIILSANAELGPLDAQSYDRDREEFGSALDEVQAVERIFGLAQESLDRLVMMILFRTRKKTDVILPLALDFITKMMRPLMEKIDTVHLTQMSRLLKVAQEYAQRLLQPCYSATEAERIARHLVEKYPEHGFVIDAIEAARFGLRTEVPSAKVQGILDGVLPFLLNGTFNAVGRLRPLPKEVCQ